MITVILADDHAVLRDGLRFLLEAEGDMEIVATAANGQELWSKPLYGARMWS